MSSLGTTPSSWTGYAPLDAGLRAQFAAAAADLGEGLRRWRSWTYLAVENVKNRYRRTVLGPWWLTIQTAIFVAGISIVFGHVIGKNVGVKSYILFVAVGYIAFILLSGLTRTGAEVFVNGSSTLKSTRQPLSNLVLREVAIELIHFAHNFVLFIPFVILGLAPLSLKMLIAVPIVVVIAVNGLFLGLWLGTAVARFRDVQPLVNSILGVIIFFSPVFYNAESLGVSPARQLVLVWNPFAYLINAFRAPLIGMPLLPSYYIGAAIVTIVNVGLGLVIFTRARSRLPYWVVS
jgi:ABC-type polysaccharide/polyol phosphate export permease